MTRMDTAAPPLPAGTVHGTVPADLRTTLTRDAEARATWMDITPLARNEWICWTVTVKQAETRKNHVERTIKELNEGKRRPCCWMGCVHRKDKPLSASQKFLLSKRSKK